MQSGFECQNCHKFVPINKKMGVANRNHCPFCLFSKHVDKIAGDRAENCYGSMKAIGLTLKKTKTNKYGPSTGELMIIHQCLTCSQFAINRIAADDSTKMIEKVFEESNTLDKEIIQFLAEQGIIVLGKKDQNKMKTQLFGLKE